MPAYYILYEKRTDKFYIEVISCLRLKYELLSFIGQEVDAGETAKRINNIIDNNDFSGLLDKHNRLVQGDTGYTRFVKTLSERITEIWEIMSASGTDESVFDDVSEEFFLNIEEKPTWSIDNLFEFQFAE